MRSEGRGNAKWIHSSSLLLLLPLGDNMIEPLCEDDPKLIHWQVCWCSCLDVEEIVEHNELQICCLIKQETQLNEVIHFCMGNESVCPVQCMSTALASHTITMVRIKNHITLHKGIAILKTKHCNAWPWSGT